MSELAQAHQSLEARIRALAEVQHWEAAIEHAIQGYGPELLRFIAAMMRDDTLAGDVFAQTCEDLWRGLPGFSWQSSFRTWAFTLTRHACYRQLRSPAHRRQGLSARDTGLERVVAAVRTATLPHLRTQMKDRLAQLRQALSLEEQELLTLRVDRALEWNDIAEILASAPLDAASRTRAAAACRKRFERVTDKLRELARAEGLLDVEG